MNSRMSDVFGTSPGSTGTNMARNMRSRYASANDWWARGTSRR
jgi:hypothetical protein